MNTNENTPHWSLSLTPADILQGIRNADIAHMDVEDFEDLDAEDDDEADSFDAAFARIFGVKLPGGAK